MNMATNIEYIVKGIENRKRSQWCVKIYSILKWSIEMENDDQSSILNSNVTYTIQRTCIFF